MSRYNAPSDFELLTVIQNLQSRIEQLERLQRPPSVIPSYQLTSTDWNAGVVLNTTSYTNIMYFPAVYYAPTPIVTFQAVASDGTTAGDFRLTDMAGVELTDINGNAVPVTPIPAGTTVATTFSNNRSPNYANDMPIGTQRFIRLQARRTAGAGTITFQVQNLIQVPA